MDHTVQKYVERLRQVLMVQWKGELEEFRSKVLYGRKTWLQNLFSPMNLIHICSFILFEKE